jgi:hypothetical protein
MAAAQEAAGVMPDLGGDIDMTDGVISEPRPTRP